MASSFWHPDGSGSIGCGRTEFRAKVYKAGRKQFLQSPLGKFRAFLAGRDLQLSSSRPPKKRCLGLAQGRYLSAPGVLADRPRLGGEKSFLPNWEEMSCKIWLGIRENR